MAETSEYHLFLLFLQRRQCPSVNDNDRIHKCKRLKFRNTNDEMAEMWLSIEWNECAPTPHRTTDTS